MKITIKRDICVGAGQCVMAAESHFDQDDDGIVVLLNEDAGDENLDAVKLAVSLCPAKAIGLS